MKKYILLILFIFLSLSSVIAQTVRGQSMNGSTGLFSIPTGRIGWETGGNIGMDFGYRAVVNNDAGTSHIPAFTLSLFNWVELSSAFDIQPDLGTLNNDDLLFGLKIRLPTKSTSIAAGFNLHLLNFSDKYGNYNAYQPYIAITYPGTFFNTKAETTIVFGKTFYSENNNSNIDFGMGFDIILFPDVFDNGVHWIIDFANFTYSDNAWPNYYFSGNPAWYRGVLNIGLRINLSAIPALSKFKFIIDLVINDVFDDGQRSFTAGAVFGFSL